MFAPFFQFAGNSGPSLAQFQAQAAAGLNVKLEYANATTIKLSSNSGSTISVITPDLNLIDVTTSGLTATVSGSTSTLYYVYLASTGLSFSTSATDTTYTNMKTLSGTKILVGYMGCSATNTIAGTYNVYSFWNQPQHTYDQSFTSTADAATFTNCQGLVVPSSVTATVSLVLGTWTGQSTFGGECSSSLTLTTNGVGSNSTSGMCGYDCATYRGHVISAPISNTLSGGVFYNIIITTTKTVNTYATPGFVICSLSSSSWTSASYTIRITRPGS